MSFTLWAIGSFCPFFCIRNLISVLVFLFWITFEEIKNSVAIPISVSYIHPKISETRREIVWSSQRTCKHPKSLNQGNKKSY